MARAEPPIACSLDAGDAEARVGEWQSVLSHATSRIAIDGGVRLVFGANPPLADISRLAVAEHDCCRFFAFAITVDERGTALEVRAPDGADEILAAVFGGAT